MALHSRSLPDTPTVRRESTGKSRTLTLMRRSRCGCCQAVSNWSADDFEGKPCTIATMSQGRLRLVYRISQEGSQRIHLKSETDKHEPHTHLLRDTHKQVLIRPIAGPAELWAQGDGTSITRENSDL